MSAGIHIEDETDHAARLGMWVFLASEVLLFSVLFTLYAAGRARYPDVFRAEVHSHAEKTFGSINTALLLVSSTFVAAAVHARREQKSGRAFAYTMTAAVMGVGFLALKGAEYLGHAKMGLVPGGVAGAAGASTFWTLYFTMTGLHSLHVLGGVIALVLAARAKVTVLDNVALYWHFVDLVWIFLWPLFYLV